MIDRIIERARLELPFSWRRNPWAYIDHGKKLLKSTDELNAYICAYGEMHKCKCLSALQNFPYEELPSTFEIVDWGCGQGIGTICMMDSLYARDPYLLRRLKRVTLIEPSPIALSRAVENISKALEGWNVEVIGIQNFLPASNDSPVPQISELNLTLPGTIHLFSNILDIISISLQKTAKIVADARGKQFVVCVGPTNDNCSRIDEFSRYFYNTSVFSDIYDPCFGVTSDTFHTFSCKTKGFYFENTSNSIAVVHEGHYTDEGAYDDYDLDAMVRNGLVSQDVLNVYRKISSTLSENDRIFLSPDLKGDKPDIVLIRPGKGIVILNVFSENLDQFTLNNGMLSRGGLAIPSPLSRVYTYRTNLIEQHSTQLLKAALVSNVGWYIVRPAIWFTNSTRVAIDSVYAGEKKDAHNPNIISGVVTLSTEDFNNNEILYSLDVKRTRKEFTKEASSEIIKMLTMQWHSYNEGDGEIVLTKRQRELAKSFDGRQIRIKGVAGSGKTQILASSAVKSQLRTGGRILILTYNITLANYIRYRIGRVPADFPWNKFVITNYHNFITTQAKNYNLKLDLTSYNTLNFFSEVVDNLPKYSAIFIDEAQDYEYNWYHILYNNFLKEGGELVIFGDEKQDVYCRRTFNSTPNLGGRTWGPWNRLKVGRRLNNQHIVNLASQFQNEFFENPDEIEQNELILSFDNKVPRYDYLSVDASADTIANCILHCIDNDKLEIQKTAILSQRVDILREIQYAYSQSTGKSSMSVFETKEEYDIILNKYNDVKDKCFRNAIEEIRTNRKTHFTMSSNMLKLSTIYSYKGWEADNIFLVIQRPSKTSDAENYPELIYTAITRAKKNLYIINLGNEKYHPFFTRIDGGDRS
ncbi:MAG: AAA family ATPase [Bacteroidales bacterium]|nr:AAA family ATPase [Bacteroidales bacterium]